MSCVWVTVAVVSGALLAMSGLARRTGIGTNIVIGAVLVIPVAVVSGIRLGSALGLASKGWAGFGDVLGSFLGFLGFRILGLALLCATRLLHLGISNLEDVPFCTVDLVVHNLSVKLVCWVARKSSKG